MSVTYGGEGNVSRNSSVSNLSLSEKWLQGEMTGCLQQTPTHPYWFYTRSLKHTENLTLRSWILCVLITSAIGVLILVHGRSWHVSSDLTSVIFEMCHSRVKGFTLAWPLAEWIQRSSVWAFISQRCRDIICSFMTLPDIMLQKETFRVTFQLVGINCWSYHSLMMHSVSLCSFIQSQSLKSVQDFAIILV